VGPSVAVDREAAVEARDPRVPVAACSSFDQGGYGGHEALGVAQVALGLLVARVLGLVVGALAARADPCTGDTASAGKREVRTKASLKRVHDPECVFA